MILLKIRVLWGTEYSFYKLSVTGFFHGAINIVYILMKWETVPQHDIPRQINVY